MKEDLCIVLDIRVDVPSLKIYSLYYTLIFLPFKLAGRKELWWGIMLF
jgi:hypothetical protein